MLFPIQTPKITDAIISDNRTPHSGTPKKTNGNAVVIWNTISRRHVACIKETKTIRIYDVDGVKIDFVDYSRYPWLADAVEEDGLRLASPKDIAAMKVNAIEGRGTRKDFVDIYYLLQHYSLTEILGFYQEKYPEHSLLRALMSLSYFDDAEKQMMPKMYAPDLWDEMKAYIIKEVEKIN